MGYHAGALKALDDFGLDVEGADVVIGTSAGSIIGSYLATGWKATDFYDYAHGKHPNAPGAEEHQDEVRRIFTPLSSSRNERVRRGLGSFFAVAAARGYWPGGRVGRMPIPWLRKTFPAGLYSTDETRERLWSDLPEEWPERELYVCAANLYKKQRVAFGAPGAPEAPLPDAVLASTAIPGVFPPVRIGGEQYVDGGVVSATSLDLAVEAGCDAVLCVAPLGYRSDGPLPTRDPRMWSPIVVRSLFARVLKREVLAARAKGVDVLVVRPWLSDLGEHGTNSMRYFDRQALADSARTGTTRFLESLEDDPVVEAFTRSTEPSERVG
jgi:NTE family protein